MISILNDLKVFVFLIFCGSSFHSLGVACLIELLHICERLHHSIGSFPWVSVGSFPWVSDLKFFLLRSSKSNKNDGAKPFTHW